MRSVFFLIRGVLASTWPAVGCVGAPLPDGVLSGPFSLLCFPAPSFLRCFAVSSRKRNLPGFLLVFALTTGVLSSRIYGWVSQTAALKVSVNYLFDGTCSQTLWHTFGIVASCPSPQVSWYALEGSGVQRLFRALQTIFQCLDLILSSSHKLVDVNSAICEGFARCLR